MTYHPPTVLALPKAGSDRADPKLQLPALAAAAIFGLVVALAIVYADFHDPWRPLAHSFGIWVASAIAVSYRRAIRPAILQATLFLAVAVTVFYVGETLYADLLFAGNGSVANILWDPLLLFLAFSVLAGAALGLLGALAARADWTGIAAAAAVIGLLLGDAFRIGASSGWTNPAVIFDVLAAAGGFIVLSRANRRPAMTFRFTVLASVLGYAVVSAPDAIESMIYRY